MKRYPSGAGPVMNGKSSEIRTPHGARVKISVLLKESKNYAVVPNAGARVKMC